MKKLISMTDYVLDYANFLKQPLELYMFVPCDGKQCLFKNFIYDEEMDVVRNNYGVEIDLKEELTIEDLTKYNLDYEINR